MVESFRLSPPNPGTVGRACADALAALCRLKEPLIYQRFLRHMMDVPLANQWRKLLIRREPSTDMCRTRRALNHSGRIVQRFLKGNHQPSLPNADCHHTVIHSQSCGEPSAEPP